MNFNGLYRDTSQPMVRFPEGPRESEGMAQARTSGDDLEVAFSRIREEMRLGARMVFRMVISGKSRALDPMIRDEAYRIGREALLNAFRHLRGRASRDRSRIRPKATPHCCAGQWERHNARNAALRDWPPRSLGNSGCRGTNGRKTQVVKSSRSRDGG